jgi:hypothetical protein
LRKEQNNNVPFNAINWNDFIYFGKDRVLQVVAYSMRPATRSLVLSWLGVLPHEFGRKSADLAVHPP